MKNEGSSFVPLLLVLIMFLGLVLGCAHLDRQNKTISDTEAKAENERKAKAEKCSQEKQALVELDAKVEDFAHLPSRLQLAAQPYLKGNSSLWKSGTKETTSTIFLRLAVACPKTVEKMQVAPGRVTTNLATFGLDQSQRLSLPQ